MFRETFYEISQDRYQKLEADSKALANLLTRLQELVTGRGEQLEQVKVPRKITIPCERCDYATDGKCSFNYPEAFTSEAHDCSMFTE